MAGVLAIINREIATGYANFGIEPMELGQLVGDWRATHRTHPWFVAELDGRVVGYCRAYPWKPREAYRFTVEIGVYVEPGLQGRGIGSRLY